MSRIIKFRAWDKFQKKFVEDFYIRGDKQIIARHINGDFWSFLPCAHFELMQYTGLKDKNGKEVYHKDIVRMAIFLYTIEWDETLAKFYLKHDNELDSKKYSMKHLKKNAEIIGSWYTHKHLLEAEG